MIELIKPGEIIFNSAIQNLCCTSYYQHPEGCPNFGNKEGCPPRQPLINKILDFNKPMYVMWTSFEIGEHAAKMQKKHPKWTARQIYCCLYWQATARKRHKLNIEFYQKHSMKIPKIVSCPEAHGVNVTALMKNFNIELEWPPRETARLISLGGSLK